jgi:energy-coupling factor transport system ATP-binding protein
MSGAVLSFERFYHRYPGRKSIDVAAPLELSAGQAALVTGPSGSGKSTLLRAIANCLPEGGETRWQVAVLPARAALALQETESQLLCSTVEEEVGFGVRNQGHIGDEATRLTREGLRAFEIEVLRSRTLESLSMGQKQRVLLAALRAMRPSLLLLDEPFSQLDEPGRAQLRRLIERHKAEGGAVLASAHHVPEDDPLWDVRLELPGAAAHFDGLLARFEAPSGPRKGHVILEHGPIRLEAGTTVHLSGDNASGKTTLLRRLVDLVADSHPDLPSRLGYLPQNADLLLFEETVEREVGFALRRTMPPAEARRRTSETLALCGLTVLAQEPPLCLSHGERHLTALASVIAARPALLLLDEPLTGLDPGLSRRVLAILNYCAHAHHIAVLLASHGPLPTAWGDSRYTITDGVVHAA